MKIYHGIIQVGLLALLVQRVLILKNYLMFIGTVHIWKLDGQNLYGPKFSHVTVSQPQALARVRIKLEYSSNYVISYRLKPVKLETLDAKEDLPFSFDEQDRDSKKENMLKTSGYLHDIHTESHNNCERKYPFLRKFGALRCFFREDSSSTTTASKII